MARDYIDIHKWKGNELLNEFIDFVNTGTANARAIASKDTGAMVLSVRVDKIADGYYVYSSAPVLRRLSGKKYFYTKRYVEDGYPNHPPFDFILEGFNAISEQRIGNGVTWRAVGSRGRNGSGSSNIRDIKIPKRIRRIS